MTEQIKLSDAEKLAWAERVVACQKDGNVDTAAVDTLAAEGEAAGHSPEDVADILNLAQDLMSHDEAPTAFQAEATQESTEVVSE